ncbi:tyrosine--tRNA ligase [Lachnospiraceae bacterium OttesenSCG-928-D06]|nr:tyrosine--tRNA ligase [Lachnospiraceae bacterium OttesenSCG-928-D06]
MKELVDKQMEVILKGVFQIVGEEQLRAKLERSIKTEKPLIIKLGLDPSAPDIHLGHGVVLRKIKQMQDLGHKAVIIIGDFTGRIGDPTGKAKGRKALSDKEVLENAQTYQEQIFRVLDPAKTEVRYNGEWLELIQLEELIRLAATTTVARMLEREDFKTRYGNNTPIGLHEFFYPLLQAYDSVEIEADVELGGTDQTFNILMGRGLQKEKGMEQQAALFMPILEGLDGVEKMSKSLGNYIGVQESAKDMFRKTMEVPDHLIIKYFELATDVSVKEIEEIKKRMEEGENPKSIKLELARIITGLYHNEEDVLGAEKYFTEAFTKKLIPEEIEVMEVIAKQENLFDVIHPLVSLGIVKSGSDMRRILQQGGIQKNGKKTDSLNEGIQTGDVLKIGKKKFVKLLLI